MDDYQIKEIKRKAELKEKVQNATVELINSLNIMGRDDEVLEALFEQVTHSHRTLQANFVRTIQHFLERYGKQEHFDARNQAAVEYAKAATEGTKTVGIPFI